MILAYIVEFLAIYISVFYLLVLLENKDKIIIKKELKNFPKVSIIIPAYNEEKTIEKTLNSVINLDYPKSQLEIIVVDDGSKDRTLEIAKKYENRQIIVLSKNNGGKGSAMNYGLKKATGEFIVSLDSDSFPEPDTLKKMLIYFEDEKVMAVTSGMKVHNPKNALQKIQAIEYLFAIFLRKIFSFLNALTVTPGPFTVFRASVFEKIGFFDEHNITEDMEIALRIQKANYKIESAPDALVYTEAPASFFSLLRQRIRWNRGYLHNFYRYRHILSPKYGDMGIFVFPVGLLLLVMLLGLFYYNFYILTSKFLMDIIMGTLIINYSIGFDWFYFQPQPIEIMLVIIILLSLVGIKFILDYTPKNNKKMVLKWYLLYLVLYFLVFTIFFWTVTLFYELRRAKLKW